jgi:predicted RND superfamily exporter protein
MFTIHNILSVFGLALLLNGRYDIGFTVVVMGVLVHVYINKKGDVVSPGIVDSILSSITMILLIWLAFSSFWAFLAVLALLAFATYINLGLMAKSGNWKRE